MRLSALIFRWSSLSAAMLRDSSDWSPTECSEKVRNITKALLVDDEKALLEISVAYLEKDSNLEVDTAGSAKEALDRLRNSNYDAIVSDYQMPEMNGIELLKHLRKNGNQTPFILFTGKGREEVVIDALNSGADFYVRKGGDSNAQFAELSNMINQAVKRRQAEEAFKHNLQHFRSLIENASDIIAIVDADSTITYVSPSVEHILGYKPEELTGTSVLHLLFQEDPEGVKNGLKAIAGGSDPGQVREYRVRHRNGQAVTLELLGKLSPRSGETRRIIINARDISDRKRIEDERTRSLSVLQATLQSTTDGILVTDSCNKIVAFNKRFQDIWEIPPDVMETKSNEEVIEAVRDQLRDPDGFVRRIHEIDGNDEIESRDCIEFKDGRIFERYSIPQRIGSTVVGRVRSFRDITEQKWRESIDLLAHEISKIADSKVSLMELCDQTREALREFMPVESFYVASYDKENESLAFPYFVDERDDHPHPRRGGHGVTEYVIRTGRHLLADSRILNELVDQGEIEILGSLPEYWLGIPLIVEGEAIGAIVVQSYSKDVQYSEREMEALRVVSNEIGKAMERKRGEELLRESEEKYRSIFENSGTCMVIVEDDSTISMVNGEFEKLTGYSKEEAEGRMKCTQLVSEGELAKLQEYHRMRRTGQTVPPRRYENRFIDKAGHIRDAMISIDLIPGTKKSIVSALDITERRKFEEALSQSESMYQSIFQNTGTATILIEEDMTISLASEEFERLSGFTRQEIEGKIKWTQFASEEDLPRMTTYHRLRRVDSMAAPNRFEFVFVNRNGQQHDISATVDMIPGTKQSVASYRDITALRTAQSMLQKEKEEQELLLDNIDTMVWYTTDPETYGQVNQAFADFLGLKKEDVEGKKTYEVRTHYEAEVCVEGNRKVFEESKPIQRLEWVTTARGDRRLIWVRKTPKFGPDGKVEYLVCSGNDITDLKKAEDALQLAKRKLTLLGIVTRHDILNKLAIVAGYSDLLEQHVGDENGRRFLRSIGKASDDIGTLLAFQGDYEMMGTKEPEWICVEDMLRQSAAHIDMGGVSVEIDLKGLEIFADPLIEKVFYNLLDNSVKHGEKVSRIGVFDRRTDRGTVIVIEDDGIGVPESRKSAIFVSVEGRSAGHGLHFGTEILSLTNMTIKETGVEGSEARFEIFVPDGRYRYLEPGPGPS